MFSVAGLTLIWRNAPDDERAAMHRLVQPLESLGGSGTAAPRATRLRLAGAAVLLAVGLGWLLSLHGGIHLLAPLGGFLLVAAGIVLLLGPWWLRIARDLVLERQARARAEERADIAARVHDSVLQTLALIQRRAEDPQAVVQLARAQERELRSWLFEGRAPGDADVSSVAEGVRQIQRDVEARHGVPVEVVTVGDCPLDEHLSALLAAAREATVNAAKWSGAAVISVFAEVEPDKVSIAVRDRGKGFDPDAVPGDRKGVAESIRGRMSRHGGEATVQSAPGEGTKVTLTMPRAAAGPAAQAADAAEGSGDEHQAATRPGRGAPRGARRRPRHVPLRRACRARHAGRGGGRGGGRRPGHRADRAALPDVVLLDVHLPGGGGQAVITEVKRDHPDVKFLALSASDAPEDVIAVIRAGARGYVTKTISTADLADAIKRVADGDAVFSHRLAGFVLDAFAAAPALDDVKPSFDPELDQLTTREREVLRLIAQGYTYKEIARELFISGKTVESHVSSVLRKLQLSSRHQLTRWATERKLT